MVSELENLMNAKEAAYVDERNTSKAEKRSLEKKCIQYGYLCTWDCYSSER